MAACWIVLGVAISIWSATFPFGTREDQGPAVFPLGCGLVLIVLGSILFFQTGKQDNRQYPQGDSVLMPHKEGGKRVGLSLGGMLLAALVFDVLGFVLTVFCLILFLMRVSQPQKWKVDLFYSLVFTVGSYVLFRIVLKTTLPTGLFKVLIDRWTL